MKRTLIPVLSVALCGCATGPDWTLPRPQDCSVYEFVVQDGGWHQFHRRNNPAQYLKKEGEALRGAVSDIRKYRPLRLILNCDRQSEDYSFGTCLDDQITELLENIYEQ